MRKILVPAFFIAVMSWGYHVSVESWDGSVFVYLGNQRSPAAVRSVRDFSAVDRSALTSSLPKQLLASAKMRRLNGYLGVTLGYPLVKTKKGTTEFACPVKGRPGIFDQVELVFIGTGVSEGGKPARLVVEAECRPGRNLKEMRTIWIPMKDILASPARDQELQLFGDQPVTVRLQQIPSAWPENWILQSARLYRDADPSVMLLVDSARVRSANPKMLAFDWRKSAQ